MISLNATRHGRRLVRRSSESEGGSRAFIARLQRIRAALRLAAHTLAAVRAHLRLRDASRRRERDLKILREFARPGLSSDLSAEARRAKAEALAKEDGPAFMRGFGHTPWLELG